MYPPSKREALLWQLQTEKVIADLTMTAYRLWLPHVEMAVLSPSSSSTSMVSSAPSELPPDPGGVSMTQAIWEFVLDSVLLRGVGLIYAIELLRAFTALSDDGEGVPAESTGAPPVFAVVPPPASGLPSQKDLGDEVRRVIAKHLAMSIASVNETDEKLRSLSSVRELQHHYLADVRNRMVGTPDQVFRGIALSVDDGLAAGESPLTIRHRVQEHLGIATGDWAGRAVTVARTESVGAQSAATIEAARLQAGVLGEDNLQQVWMCTLDGKTRPSHFAADGQRVALGSRFKVGHTDLRYPGDPSGPASETINCRCRVAVLDASEALPGETDRHTERGPGDSTVKNRKGSQADEIARRAADGVIRARDDEDGIGSVAAAGAPASVTVTETQEGNRMAQYRSFTSVLAVIGEKTDDGRMFAADIDLSFRDFPLPLLWQRQASGGHFDSFTVGVIEDAHIDGTKVIGSGYLLNTPEADEAADQAEHKVTAPSVDLGGATWVLTDEDGNPVDWESLLDEGVDPGSIRITETITSGKILGATLVSLPAFGSTSLTVGELVDKGSAEESIAASLVASVAAGFTPPSYPGEFFANPEFSGPTMPQLTADGRIMGHLATFNTCHVGIQDSCVMAPRSQTDYAWFHTSPPVLTTEGKRVSVGRLTVGGGHAGAGLGVGPAVAHYDDVGTAFALVHVGEDEHGIWFSGVPAPGATEEQIAAGLSAPLSGDWRVVGGNLELVAALAVNTPGFPILASGATDERDAPLSLVASLGPCKDVAADSQLSEGQMRAFARAFLAEQRAAAKRTAVALALIDKAEAPRRAARKAEALALITGGK